MKETVTSLQADVTEMKGVIMAPGAIVTTAPAAPLVGGNEGYGAEQQADQNAEPVQLQNQAAPAHPGKQGIGLSVPGGNNPVTVIRSSDYAGPQRSHKERRNNRYV